MNRRSASGSVVGSSNLAARASSTMVSGRRALSRWVCSSALGSRRISSRVSIASPPGPHHHPKDGSTRQGLIRVNLDPSSIGDIGLAGDHPVAQGGVEPSHGVGHRRAGGQIHQAGVDEHSDLGKHGRKYQRGRRMRNGGGSPFRDRPVTARQCGENKILSDGVSPTTPKGDNAAITNQSGAGPIAYTIAEILSGPGMRNPRY